MLKLIKKIETRLEKGHWRRYGVFECSYCGKIVERRVSQIPKSCGCATFLKSNSKHGYSTTRLYQIWADIKRRCLNIKCDRYHRYGGRGILLCEEWKTFIPFLKWAIDNNYTDHLTIDRKDNDGNYEPSNCRFITIQQNLKNRPINRNTQRKNMSIGRKLKREDIVQIRQQHTNTYGDNIKLAKKYNVTSSCICSIIKRRIWKHVS